MTVSGRYDTLKTELDFPRGEMWLADKARENSIGDAKRKRIALEQFDRFLVDKIGVSEVDAIDDFDSLVMDVYSHIDDEIDAANELLKRFSYWLEDEGLAHSTIEGRWYDVRMYLNYKENGKENREEIGYLEGENEYIIKWLDSGSEARKQLDREDVKWLELDDIKKLIDGAKNYKNEMVIRCLWEFGCRPRELANVKLYNHNPKTRSFTIRTLKIKDSDHELYTRNVYYSRSMRKYMDYWLNQGERDAYSHASDSDYLIVGYNTESISGRQINKIVRDAAESSDIQADGIVRADGHVNNRVTARSLRHSFAVHNVRGVKRTGSPAMDIERLRRLMGHRSIKSTQSYLRYRDIDIRDAYDRCHPTLD